MSQITGTFGGPNDQDYSVLRFTLGFFLGSYHIPKWEIMKIMASFWVLGIILPLLLKVPKRSQNFDNPQPPPPSPPPPPPSPPPSFQKNKKFKSLPSKDLICAHINLHVTPCTAQRKLPSVPCVWSTMHVASICVRRLLGKFDPARRVFEHYVMCCCYWLRSSEQPG